MLLAHCNTDYVDESQVLAIDPPEGTATWQPIAHRELIFALEVELTIAQQFEIIRKDYSLSQDGHQMFGVWTLQSINNDMAFALGLRNSTNKRLSVGVVAGTRVFVCDNLAFSGEFIVFRRHTSRIRDDLHSMVAAAVEQVSGKLLDFADWHKQLINYCLPKQRAEMLTFRAMEQRILPPSKFNQFYKLFFDAKAPYRAPTLLHWHEAITEILREYSLFRQADANAKLNALCQGYIDQYGHYA